MTSEEQRAVAALSGGLPPPRTRRPSGAAFGLAFGQPAWMKPPPDPAARAARIATGAEGPGGANHLARLEGLAAGGRTPVEYRDDENEGTSYNPLTAAAREYENNGNDLYSNGNNNGNIPAPAPAGPTVDADGNIPKRDLFAMLLGLFGVPVPFAPTDAEFLTKLLPALFAAVREGKTLRRPEGAADALASYHLPKLPPLLQAEKDRVPGSATGGAEKGTTEWARPAGR